MSNTTPTPNADSFAARNSAGLNPEEVLRLGKLDLFQGTEGPIVCQLEAASPDLLTLVPGLGDLSLARLSRIGHKDKFPRRYDWENLLPLLRDDQELLWIFSYRPKDPDNSCELFLGVRTVRGPLDSPTFTRERQHDFAGILQQFQGRAFPESQCTPLDAFDTSRLIHEMPIASCHLVTGMPSQKAIPLERGGTDRQEEVRPYQTLNDVVEPYMGQDAFSIVFALQPAQSHHLAQELSSLNAVKDRIRPLMNYQLGRQEGESEGITGGTTSGSTDTTGHSTSEGSSDTTGGGIGFGIPTPFGFFGLNASYSHAWTRGTSDSTSHSQQESTSEGWNKGYSTSQSWTETHENSRLKLLDEFLSERIKDLVQALGNRGYHGTTTIYSDNQEIGERLGRSLGGTLSGTRTHLHPFQVTPVKGQGILRPLTHQGSYRDVFRISPILPPDSACQLLLLPEAELPGIGMKRNVFYGQSPKGPEGNRSIRLGQSPSALGPSGKGTLGNRKSKDLTVIPEDLLSHILITGTTGSGKTTRAIRLLEELKPEMFRLLIIETAKKNFRGRLVSDRGELKVLTLGGTDAPRFRINPFYFDEGTSLKRHISVLSDALSQLLPREALIGPKLREAIQACYFDLGWNIESGGFQSETEPIYPSFLDFNAKIQSMCQAGLGYSQEVEQNYRGALLGRSRVFLDDLYQDIFSHGGNLPFDQLFDGDCILELDDLPPSEIQMPGFILSIVLQRLRAYRSLLKDRDPERRSPVPYHMVVIEEAHNLLGREREARGSAMEADSGHHLLEQVVRLLQEGRELGIGVMAIDQSPSRLASDVLKNTNIKIIHRLVDGEELEVVGRSIGLLEQEWPDLIHLQDGECVVKTKSSGRPIRLGAIDSEYARRFFRVPEQKPMPILIPDYAEAQRCLLQLRHSPEPIQLLKAYSRLQVLAFHRLDLFSYFIGKGILWDGLAGNGGATWFKPYNWDTATILLADYALGHSNWLHFRDLLSAELAGEPDDSSFGLETGMASTGFSFIKSWHHIAQSNPDAIDSTDVAQMLHKWWAMIQEGRRDEALCDVLRTRLLSSTWRDTSLNLLDSPHPLLHSLGFSGEVVR